MQRRGLLQGMLAMAVWNVLMGRAGAAQPTSRGKPGSPKPKPTEETTMAVYEGRLVLQPNDGMTNVPDYESAHLTKDGKLLSIGWIGIHSTELSNSIKEFDPVTLTCETVQPWTQQMSATDPAPKVPPSSTGYNTHCNTYDNHPSGYFSDTDTTVWFGHCVWDRASRQYLRGNRTPQTRNWNTYCTGYDAFSGVYNPAYAQCLERHEVLFFGSSSGGTGDGTTMVVWRPTGIPDAPYAATRVQLSGKGMKPLQRVRNAAECIGSTFYVGGGTVLRAGSIVDSLFHTTEPNEYQDGDLFFLLPGSGQSAMPSPMIWGKGYYIRDNDPVAQTFRIAETSDGLAMTVANFTGWLQGTPNYRMWAIGLADAAADFTVKLVCRCPRESLLIYDSDKNRLVMIGKKVWTMDPLAAAPEFTQVNVTGWPASGFRAPTGGYVNGKVFFRGVPLDGNPKDGAWHWNSIQFS